MFGASSELASVMAFGFYFQQTGFRDGDTIIAMVNVKEGNALMSSTSMLLADVDADSPRVTSVINSAVGCPFFLPGPRLPSQL